MKNRIIIDFDTEDKAKKFFEIFDGSSVGSLGALHKIFDLCDCNVITEVEEEQTDNHYLIKLS